MLKIGDVIINRTGRKHYAHKIVAIDGSFFVTIANGREVCILILRANDKKYFVKEG